MRDQRQRPDDRRRRERTTDARRDRRRLGAVLGLLLLATAPALTAFTGGENVTGRDDSGKAAARTGGGGGDGLATATLGGGCFWCVEAVFQHVAGVTDVVSGYAGGHVPDPTYKQVCSGDTGHAEVVQVTFDPARISYEEILTIFFGTHDPTTPNRQGADVGTQYRSVIFHHDVDQAEAARAVIRELEREQVFADPIVTEVAPLDAFYPAEDHHQDYYARNAGQPYCQVVIAPKLKKLQERFADRLKR